MLHSMRILRYFSSFLGLYCCQMIYWVPVSAFYKHSLYCDVMMITYVTNDFMFDIIKPTAIIQVFRCIKLVTSTMPIFSFFIDNGSLFKLNFKLFFNHLLSNLVVQPCQSFVSLSIMIPSSS